MSACIFIPSSLHEAAKHLRASWRSPLINLPKSDFLRVWSAIAYLFPELHPDGYDDPDSGWPRVLKVFAAEAWRRVEIRDLEDEDLYASDAQWAGLYDRMMIHTPDETSRRQELAAKSDAKFGFYDSSVI